METTNAEDVAVKAVKAVVAPKTDRPAQKIKLNELHEHTLLTNLKKEN